MIKTVEEGIEVLKEELKRFKKKFGRKGDSDKLEYSKLIDKLTNWCEIRGMYKALGLSEKEVEKIEKIEKEIFEEIQTSFL